ncbi:hypothetical protein D3C72_371360 [compost metagenome]
MRNRTRRIYNLVLTFIVLEGQFQTQTSQLVYQYIKGFRSTRFRDIISFHNRFICFRTTYDIIRFDRQ